MCGIVGFASVEGSIDPELLAAQRDAMVHRGPDSAGLWISEDKRVGLAHRRLAIIDLSPGGHQPMVDPLTGNVITFNGEIYNFRRLRADLEALGERFTTSSDTEVILAGYRVWGVDVVRRLDGMFAFGLYDHNRQELLLARDRAGEKPMFLHHGTTTLRFASELKALLVDRSLSRRVNVNALDEYLTYGYVSGDRCLLDGFTKLDAACCARYSLHRGTLTIEPYWSLPDTSASERGVVPSEHEAEEWTDQLDTVLRDAVRDQLVADVPVGILLSGGLDSSLIAAIARQVSASPLTAFTVGMHGKGAIDETPFAKQVAEHIGMRHVVLEARGDSASVLPRLLSQYDEPLADSSMLPTYLVAQAIREHATVAIGGDGGDELFGGYGRYSVHIRQDALRSSLIGPARRMAGVAAGLLPEDTKGRPYLQSIAGHVGTSIANSSVLFGTRLRSRLLGRRPTGVSAWQRRAEQQSQRASALQRSTAVDFGTYMRDDVLVKVDRASMLASLEVRAPFLHRPVIEFAFGGLPDALRASRDARKIILRRLARRYLPRDFDSARKQGFSIPLQSWLSGDWRGLLVEVMQAEPLPCLDQTIVHDLVARAPATSRDADRQFALLAFAHWCREYRVSE